MSFLDKLKKLFNARRTPSFDERSHWVYVRCNRCGEIIPTRIDLLNDLTRDYDTGKHRARKVVVGSGENRCFQRIELDLVFDHYKQLVEQQVVGGTIVEPPQEEEPIS